MQDFLSVFVVFITGVATAEEVSRVSTHLCLPWSFFVLIITDERCSLYSSFIIMTVLMSELTFPSPITLYLNFR